METNQQITFTFPAVCGFDFMIKRSTLYRKNHVHEIELHSHRELEIYINLSGDVSFLVENELLPVERGDAIISRPHETHHCVYRSDAEHNLFWLLIDTDQNKEIFAPLLSQLPSHFISLSPNGKETLVDLCYKLMEQGISDLERYRLLFQLLALLSATPDNIPKSATPPDLSAALDHIDKYITQPMKISDLAAALYLSESTLQRRFRQYLQITPLDYVQKKKMILAERLLAQGSSVLDAGLAVGFSDNSYFIQLFRRFYGMTPLEYKKHCRAYDNGNQETGQTQRTI